MFYSRPKLEPLGWDLIGLPTPNGSRNFDGMTSDRRPVDFRFSSGWLTVERGEAGAPQSDTDTETVLSVPISPFGVMDIYPEQICDILGLTVHGKSVPLSAIPLAARGFDWSGRTTYWHSRHRMLFRGDADTFAAKIQRALPGSIMIQPSWEWSPPRVRCRRIESLGESDRVVMIGSGGDQDRLARMSAGEEIPAEEFDRAFRHRIDLSHAGYSGEDPTGKTYIDGRGADKLTLDYQVLQHRQYQIRTEYLTDDPDARFIMQELLAVINDHFCRDLEVVNLQTGAVVEEAVNDEDDTMSYSRSLRNWCLENPQRYLSVGIHTTSESTRAPGDPVFVGWRPINIMKR